MPSSTQLSAAQGPEAQKSAIAQPAWEPEVLGEEEERAFVRELDELRPSLLYKALGFTRGDRDMADDLVQEASIHLWRCHLAGLTMANCPQISKSLVDLMRNLRRKERMHGRVGKRCRKPAPDFKPPLYGKRKKPDRSMLQAGAHAAEALGAEVT